MKDETATSAFLRSSVPSSVFRPPSSASAAIAVIDCNNFYISCERVFDPRLAGRAVVVLSNNDGCIIARSNEAKRLGIRMGAPLFQVADLLKRHEVAVLSSNYTLYGDMSARVMRVLEEASPETEIYSIDEAFMNLAAGEWRGAKQKDYADAGRELQRRVRKWTGIPVTIGIAETKTLAKIAARIAKTSDKTRGVLSLLGSTHTERALARTPIEDVWGIGRAHAAMLRGACVMTALDLRNKDDAWVRRRMSIVGLRLVHELRGVSCLPLEFAPPPKRSLTVSRSFGSPVETLSEMREAVAHFAARAAEKLRGENLIAGALTIFLSTNRFNSAPQYASSAIVHLPVPTDFTPELIRAAHRGADRIFAEGYSYKKAGVILLELLPAAPAQPNLYATRDEQREAEVMSVVDRINARFGQGTIRYLATGVERRWQTRADNRSPRYTTHWREIITIAERPPEASSHLCAPPADERTRRPTPAPFVKTDYEVH